MTVGCRRKSTVGIRKIGLLTAFKLRTISVHRIFNNDRTLEIINVDGLRLQRSNSGGIQAIG
jgi:hypothetical protein